MAEKSNGSPRHKETEPRKDPGFYLNLKEVFTYYFRKKDPNRPTNTNIKLMHGINRIAIIVFLICLVVIITRFIIRAF